MEDGPRKQRNSGYLLEYVRNENNQKTGVLFSWTEIGDPQIHIGFSFCRQKPMVINKKGEPEKVVPPDKFDKAIGFFTAAARSIDGLKFDNFEDQIKYYNSRMHPDYADDIIEFIERSRRYFKNYKLPLWATEILSIVPN